jgi:hypothetical protein
MSEVSKQQSVSGAHEAVVGRDHVTLILGEMDEARIVEILALKPTLLELEEAATWAAGDGDILARTGHPLSAVAARIVDILTSDEEEPPPTG